MIVCKEGVFVVIWGRVKTVIMGCKFGFRVEKI